MTATQQLNDVLSYSFDWSAGRCLPDVVDSPAASATTSFDTPAANPVQCACVRRVAQPGRETVVQVNAQSLSIQCRGE